MPQRLAFPPEPQLPTAASIAAEHFQKEADLHQVVDLKSKTAVIVHDACYGHRFSRPRATKTYLSQIVERPERIRACVLGISAAYVRLGRRYAGERYAPHPDLDVHMLPPPPFQIRKTSRKLALSDSAVTNVHGTQWMADLKSMCDVAESRLALVGKELVKPPGPDGESNGPSLHEGDLYLCSESLNAFEGALGGVCEGIDTVLGPGPTRRAFVCIRPPGHHCSADWPSGFCWINNVHVGISYAALNHGLTHAAILDFDLHHGDGSQEITWNHNYKATTAPRNAAPHKKTAIGYYSLHDINSYPCEAGDPDKVRNASVCLDGAHGQSIWNVHLDTWETEDQFWTLYQTKYLVLLDKARNFLRQHTQRLYANPTGPRPKAAIFISAGFDASEWESTGMQRHKVNVPTEFYARFTADVVRMSQEEGLGVDGRVISVLEGGYSDRALMSGVLSHISGLGSESADNSLASAMDSGMNLSEMKPKDTLQQPSNHVEYDKEWWSSPLLAEIEALVDPAPKPIKGERSSTLFNETNSFKAKKVNIQDRKSFSSPGVGTRPNIPPPPEVGWAIATHELSKILIPQHRQTKSCRPEELNAEASRQRRDRQVALDGGINPAIIPPPPEVPNTEEKRQLRVRKTKSPTPFSPRSATPRQQAMRKNRRRTIDANELPDPSRESSPSLDASRRKSSTATAPISLDLASTIDQTTTEKGPATPSKSPAKPTARKTSGGSRPGTPKRTASPRKAPPVPKVPTAFLPSKLGEEVTPPKDDNMDKLTSGLQRVKLTMPKPLKNMPDPSRSNGSARPPPSLASPAFPPTQQGQPRGSLQDLPVFTSSSPIPFATPETHTPNQGGSRPPTTAPETPENPGSQDPRPFYP
jgi:histone deacetylase HOS3